MHRQWKEGKRGRGKVSESVYRFPDSGSFLERIRPHARSLEHEYEARGEGYKRDALPRGFAFARNGPHRAARGQARRARGREDSRSRTRRCEEGTPQRGNWRTELMHTKRHARNVIIANLWTQSRDSHTTRDRASVGPRFHRWNYSCYSFVPHRYCWYASTKARPVDARQRAPSRAHTIILMRLPPGSHNALPPICSGRGIIRGLASLLPPCRDKFSRLRVS